MHEANIKHYARKIQIKNILQMYYAHQYVDFYLGSDIGRG